MAIHFGTLLAIAAGPAALPPRADSLPPAAAAVLTPADLEAWLDGRIGYSLAEGDIPGALVVVVRDGRVFLAKGYGYADVARKVPIDPARTMLGVGSISKLFTWTAVMQQVERGKLDLDADVARYLDFPIPPAFGRPILLRHLLTHTPGLEDRSFSRVPVPRSLAAYLKGTPVPDRIEPPGTVEAYSNYGAMIGGYLVERVSGEKFADYVERQIFQPLGMSRSSFRHPLPDALRPDQALSYSRASEPPNPPDALDHEEPATDPSGHFSTTGADLARFMLAHLDEGRTDQRLLRPETMQRMHAPAFVPIPGAHPITLGFFRADYRGHRIISHGGDIEDFHADLSLLLDDGIGVFVWVNGGGTSRGPFGAGDYLRFTLLHEFIRRYFPAPPDSVEPTLPTAAADARAVVGEYRMSRRGVGDFRELESLIAAKVLNLRLIANDDGTITTPEFADWELGRPLRWREVGPFQWREVDGERRLDMTVENGKVRAWLPRDLYSFVLEPVPWAKRASWNLPLAYAAIAVLLLATTLGLWRLIVRRKPAPSSVTAAAVVGLLYLIAWAALLSGGAVDGEHGHLWIRLAQGLGLVVIVATAISLVATVRAARAGAGWKLIIGRGAVTVALLDLVWISVAFHLLSLRLNY
jgi:CubicO group peptidase (beta-lactamase class C family)